jgi:mRNA-degrading endonuclease toxin of MazEF toxin-antitoxin module
MDKSSLNTGDVYKLDIGGKTLTGTYTVKYHHCYVIITNNALISQYNHPIVNCVPVTSLNYDKHWDNNKACPKFFFHYPLYKKKYDVLERDSIVMCEHLYTLDRIDFQDYKFTVDKIDVDNIRQKIARVLGYSRN